MKHAVQLLRMGSPAPGSNLQLVERRAHRRVEVEASLVVVVEGRSLRGSVVNLSMGGLGCVLGDVQAGIADLRIELHDGTIIETEGELVWSRDGRAGYRFISLGQRALLALLGIVGRG